jgi:hypothetical protein
VPTPASILAYPFFASALTFAHRFFAARQSLLCQQLTGRAS